MPSTSEKQRRFFGLVRAIQKGEAHGSPKAEKAARSMSVSDVRDFAKSTKKSSNKGRMSALLRSKRSS